MIYSSTSSSSLWGCELKNPISVIRKLATSHPPCEDVSWKSNIARGSSDYLVILLVRMWVENTPPINVMIPTLRHPPCEDVSWKDNIADIDGGWFGHPPCEDVSWKVKDHASEITETVILLVRMWVEKLYGVARHYRTTVILLVRMWVEKFLVLFFSCLSTVILLVRMWVEKAYALLFFPGSIGHPPCEDVSWKFYLFATIARVFVILLVRMWVEKLT